MSIEARIQQVDDVVQNARVSVEGLSTADQLLASEICEHFKLPYGKLIRRAEAINLLGEGLAPKNRLQEAAQHLIYR